MSISVEELLKLTNPNIIDIRTIQDYNNNHIAGALNIRYEELITNPSKYLNKSEEYYIYCRRGKTSLWVSQMLRKKGYHTYSVLGGYEAYVLNS